MALLATRFGRRKQDNLGLGRQARSRGRQTGEHREVRAETAELLRTEVASMNLDNFVVRPHRRLVEKYREPAAWADLAIVQMRTGNLDGAAQSLAKALEAAPPSSQLEVLAGVMASRQGKVQEALTHLRKATELDPRNLVAQYALVEELGRELDGLHGRRSYQPPRRT